MQPNKECKKCRVLLWNYATDSLDKNESQLVLNHLENCPSCSKEYYSIKKIATAMNTTPEPDGEFQKALHAKLISASVEMERERKASGNSFKEKIEKFRSYGGWKSLAPALVCLVLAVGFFSSGLFENWMDSDKIIQTGNPSVQTQTPAAEETLPSTTENEVSTVASAPKNNSSTDNVKVNEITEQAPQAEPQKEIGDDIPAVPAPVSEPIPASEPIEQEPMAMSGRTVMNSANIISTDDIESFINSPDIGFDLSECVTDIQADTLLPGLPENAVVLSLSPEQWTDLLEYMNSNNISVQQAQQNEDQRELLVILTECEE